jgi:valyl-tRNA synthetase
MVQCLSRILRLLHPFCPFLTEEIYQKLPLKNEACIIDTYPTPTNDKDFLDLGSASAEYETDLLKEVISAVRNIRGENRISPAEKLNLRLAVSSDDGQKILSFMRPTILNLGRIAELTIEEEGKDLKMCAVSQVSVRDTRVKVIIPLQGLVDVDEEVKRIHKAIEKLNKDVSLLSQKLSNEKFVAKADEEVVQADRELLAANRNKLISMQEALGRLQGV